MSREGEEDAAGAAAPSASSGALPDRQASSLLPPVQAAASTQPAASVQRAAAGGTVPTQLAADVCEGKGDRGAGLEASVLGASVCDSEQLDLLGVRGAGCGAAACASEPCDDNIAEANDQDNAIMRDEHDQDEGFGSPGYAIQPGDFSCSEGEEDGHALAQHGSAPATAASAMLPARYAPSVLEQKEHPPCQQPATHNPAALPGADAGVRNQSERERMLPEVHDLARSRSELAASSSGNLSQPQREATVQRKLLRRIGSRSLVAPAEDVARSRCLDCAPAVESLCTDPQPSAVTLLRECESAAAHLHTTKAARGRLRHGAMAAQAAAREPMAQQPSHPRSLDVGVRQGGTAGSLPAAEASLTAPNCPPFDVGGVNLAEQESILAMIAASKRRLQDQKLTNAMLAHKRARMTDTRG